jgi:hypothetical protein
MPTDRKICDILTNPIIYVVIIKEDYAKSLRANVGLPMLMLK